MPYTSGETPMVGDSIRDKGGRLGSVTAASNGGIFTISWNEGVVGADYKAAERFTLISRLSERDEKQFRIEGQ
jgi:hypothetical protein